MDKKTVWNLHLLDKLFFVNKQDNSVDDLPIMKMEIDGRSISIPLDESNVSHVLDMKYPKEPLKLFFNKIDAEVELRAHITPIQ